MKQFSILLFTILLLIFLPGNTKSQWVNVSGLGGGGTKALAVNGTNLFVGTEQGVYLSTDNGLTWTEVNNGLPATYIWYLKVSGNNLYACTGGVGLFRTTDSGASWSNLGLISEVIYTCAVNGSAIFAGTHDHGIYRSTDDGVNWNQVNNGLNTIDVRALFVNGNSIFAGTFPGMYRSNDNGENWVELTNGLPNPMVNVLAFTMIGSTLFAGLDGGVYYSTDNGDIWNAAGLSGTYPPTIISYGTNLFAGLSGDGIYYSNDNGLNWAAVNEGLPTPVYPQSLLTSGDKIFLAAWYEGLFWRPLSELVSSVPGSDTDVPTKYSLFQNYPNPFNPNTSIKYSIPQLSNVLIKIFDVLGNEVETLVNEEKSVGTYEITWYAEQLPSGIYFYQLKAGDPSTSSGQGFVETKKMILLK